MAKKIELIFNNNEAANMLEITPPEFAALMSSGELTSGDAGRIRESDIRAYKETHWPAEGFVTVMGGSLQIEVFGKEWNLSIRSEDGKSHASSFFEYHNKRITPDIIRQYIPDTECLEWRELAIFLGIKELTACSNGYRLNICYNADSQLDAETVKKEFSEFMHR